MPELLLTGFEGFLGRAKNPSWDALAELARRYPRLISESGRIAIERLPVTFRETGVVLCNAIDRWRPTFVISLGMHGGPDSGGRGLRTFYVERVAHNWDEAAAPDNNGEVRRGQIIDPTVSAKSTYATIDSESLLLALRASSFEAELSDDAGRYLCNHAFFCALTHPAPYHPPPRIGFVHVPPGEDLQDGSLSLEQHCAAVVAMVEAILPGAFANAGYRPADRVLTPA